MVDSKVKSAKNTEQKEPNTQNTSNSPELAHFKPFEAPKRKAGLRDDQVSISKHSINVPLNVLRKMAGVDNNGREGTLTAIEEMTVSLLYSDTDKAVAIRKGGEFKFKTLKDKSDGKLKPKATVGLYAKALIETKKIKPGRYSTTYDEKNQILIARL